VSLDNLAVSECRPVLWFRDVMLCQILELMFCKTVNIVSRFNLRICQTIQPTSGMAEKAETCSRN
jgi:hypothetical protein